MHILIMEDDPTSQFLMRKLLEPYGECDVVDNGIEAVEGLRVVEFHIFPYRNGVEGFLAGGRGEG